MIITIVVAVCFGIERLSGAATIVIGKATVDKAACLRMLLLYLYEGPGQKSPEFRARAL
jgi:hypothetical protein